MPHQSAESAEARLTIKYRGDGATRGEFDAYDLAGAIEGFSNFARAIGTLQFGNKVEFRPSVVALRRGSFDVSFVLHFLATDIAGIFYSAMQVPDTFSHFVKLVAEAFELLKHLGGEPPKSIRHGDGNVYVENNNGIINQYSADTLILILDPTVGRAVRSFAGRPLEHSAREIDIMSGDQVVASAQREDANSFVPINTGDVLVENTNEVHLTIQTAVFEGKNRWKFNDGRTTFSAPIEDVDFLARVQRGGEAFRRGDELVVRMRSIQKRINGQLKAEYIIEKVVKHVSPPGPGKQLL